MSSNPLPTPVPATTSAPANQFSLTLQHVFDTYEIRRNVVTGVVESRPTGTAEDYSPVNENDLYLWLKTSGYRITLTDVTALLSSGMIPQYDPFISYFESLPKPDGEPERIIEDHADHVLTTDQPEWCRQFTKWLVRAVRCALEPDYMNKQAMILHSNIQNLGKSTYLRYLIPPRLKQYYCEALTPDKDGLTQLVTNLIINLDELTGLSKFELNQLKAHFSRTTVSVRRPYERRATTDPRRCSFCGSTNDLEFLTDVTGSVRWLIFSVVDIDFSYVNAPIDLVWSAAYQLYLNGYPAEMTPDELRQSAKRNETFSVTSAEEDYILRHFTKADEGCHHTDEGCHHFSATMIMDYLNDRHPAAHLRSVDKIGKAMQKLGYQRIAKKINGTVRRGYSVILLGEFPGLPGCQVATGLQNF